MKYIINLIAGFGVVAAVPLQHRATTTYLFTLLEAVLLPTHFRHYADSN